MTDSHKFPPIPHTHDVNSFKTVEDCGGRVVSSVVAHKDDVAKWKPSVLQFGVEPLLKWIAEVREYGNRKYDKNSWREVENAEERYREALYRHVLADMNGERIDPESGLTHLQHASCNLMFLAYFESRPEMSVLDFSFDDSIEIRDTDGLWYPGTIASAVRVTSGENIYYLCSVQMGTSTKQIYCQRENIRKREEAWWVSLV